MSRVWKLLCCFLLVISPAMVRGAGTASVQKDDIPPSDHVVQMDKLVVTAARYHWRYAKSEHFEILSSYADDDFVTRVVQIAELAIKPYEKNLSIYRSNRELPAKLIFVESNQIERFFTATGEVERIFGPDRKFGDSSTPPSFPTDSAFDDKHEQVIIIRTISPPNMNATRWRNMDKERVLEQTARMYGMSIAGLYRWNCLNGNKIFGSANKNLTGFAERDWNFRFLTHSLPNIKENTLTLDRFNPNIEIWDIKNLATYDYENKLSDPYYGKPWAMTLPIDKPLFNLRNIVESSAASFPPRPAKGCSVRDVQKYFSFMRQLKGFCYYCAFGPNPKTRDAFVNLMKYKGKQLPITEEIFKRCFGKNYEEFSDEMDDFYGMSSQDTKYQDNAWGDPTMVIGYFDPQKVPKLAWADATRSQSARMISDWFFTMAYPDDDGPNLNMNDINIARQTLDLAIADAYYVRNDPEFCAAWGLSEMQYGDKATALTLLEKAASAKVARPAVYRSLSRLYLENILASKEKDYKLDEAEVQKVFDPLVAALKLWQRNPQTYLQIFDLAQHTNVPFPKELWKTIADNCTQLFPDNFTLINQLVPLLLKNGLKDEATRLLDATAKCPLTTKEQQQLEQLKAMGGGQNADS